jgi:hypothetical protein
MFVPFSRFCVLFVCKCVLYCWYRVSTQYISHVLGILELHPVLVIGQLSRNSSPIMSQGTQLYFVPAFNGCLWPLYLPSRLKPPCSLCAHTCWCTTFQNDILLDHIFIWIFVCIAQAEKSVVIVWERVVLSLCGVGGVIAVCWCVMWSFNFLRLPTLKVEMRANRAWNICGNY